MIKKVAAIFLVTILVLSFAACGGDKKEEEPAETPEEVIAEVAPIEIPKEEPKPVEKAPEKEAVVEPVAEPPVEPEVKKEENPVPPIEQSKPAVVEPTPVEPGTGTTLPDTTKGDSTSKTGSTDTKAKPDTGETKTGDTTVKEGSGTSETKTGGTTTGSTPQHGAEKTENGKGYVWVEGFGWVERGGPNSLVIVE